MNSRIDFIHKETTSLVKKYDVICIEDLKAKEMLKDKRLSKSISDASFYEFRRELEYKTTWTYKRLMVVDQYFPSSQLCSCCGYKNKEIKDLSIRNWECPSCESIHDRDRNASINILNEGLRIMKEVI